MSNEERADEDTPSAEMLLPTRTVGSTRWITVDRVPKRNAWTFPMAERLGVLLDEAAADDAVRVVVIAGAGGVFSAGLDRGELSKGTNRPSPFPVDELVQFPKPTIAAVDGLAFGGGATMAAACDLRVVSTRSTFSFALGKLGLTPEWGSSYLLWRQIGWSRALDLFLSGRTVDAEEAYRLGLADRLVDPDDLDAVTTALADAIASVPPGTAEATKRVLWGALEAPDLAAARAIELRTLGERGKALRAMREAREA